MRILVSLLLTFFLHFIAIFSWAECEPTLDLSTQIDPTTSITNRFQHRISLPANTLVIPEAEFQRLLNEENFKAVGQKGQKKAVRTVTRMNSPVAVGVTASLQTSPLFVARTKTIIIPLNPRNLGGEIVEFSEAYVVSVKFRNITINSWHGSEPTVVAYEAYSTGSDFPDCCGDPLGGTPQCGLVSALHHRFADDMVTLGLRAEDGEISFEKATTEHPFYISGKGFVEVGDLNVGDLIETTLGEVEIVSLLNALWKRPVFNISVDKYETYFIGTEKSWVHNCSSSVDEAIESGALKGGGKLEEILRAVEKSFKKNKPTNIDDAGRALNEGTSSAGFSNGIFDSANSIIGEKMVFDHLGGVTTTLSKNGEATISYAGKAILKFSGGN